jgi:hypothetical protein
VKVKHPIVLYLVVLLVAIFATATLAATGYADVPQGSEYYDAVSWLLERDILSGTIDNNFYPNNAITVQEWAEMLYKAYGGTERVSEGDYITYCHNQGWMSGEQTTPDDVMSRRTMLASAIGILNTQGYKNLLESIASQDPVQVGKQLGLCATETTGAEEVTRGEAAQMLYKLMADPSGLIGVDIPKTVTLEETDAIKFNKDLVAFKKVPKEVVKFFVDSKWTCSIGEHVLDEYNQVKGEYYTGITSYSTKKIYIASDSAVVHEFGHFLDWKLGFPKSHEQLYNEEAQNVKTVIRAYAATNSREYFADYFSYWNRYRDNADAMAKLQAASPETYQYFTQLEANGWTE